MKSRIILTAIIGLCTVSVVGCLRNHSIPNSSPTRFARYIAEPVRIGDKEYTGYAVLSGTTKLAFRNSDGSVDVYDTRTHSWKMGFQNSDGSEDTYDLGSGSWNIGFGNSDGSEDTYDLRSGSWKMGFDNGDGTQDTYNMQTGT